MKKNNPLRPITIILGLSAAMLIAGCASKAPDESGFLKNNYSLLHKEPAPGGGNRLVYVSPVFTPANYSALWVDPVVYYPEPKPTENVSMETLTQIRQVIDNTLRTSLGKDIKLVDRAGPGVAHLRIAITAVGTQDQALAFYQYIPIALVVTGAKAAMEGGLPQDASIAIESQVTDSVSGQVLYASVRGGTGDRIKNAAQGQGGVQLSSLKPLLDKWAMGITDEARKYVRAK